LPRARPALAVVRGQGGTAPPRLGAILLENGALKPGDLIRALALQGREQARLGDILVGHAMVTEAELFDALALQWHAGVPDLANCPPDPRLVDLLGAQTCLRDGLLPWKDVGGATVVLTARPEEFERHRPALEDRFGRVIMGLTNERDLHAGLLTTRRADLRQRAESRVAPRFSCRVWTGVTFRRAAFGAGLCLALLLSLAPVAALAGVTALALAMMVLNTGLRATAALATLRGHGRPAPDTAPRPIPHPIPHPVPIGRLPVVSVMVPLYHEPDIAPRLVARLGRLTYPKELLDVLLLVEAEDTATRAALHRARLPRWMRVITVPAGPIKTKPRALNFGLDFCRGSVIGVYDAEDAPEADQIHRVVRRFHAAGPDVACVQGVLDFYNPRRNWLSRCFTVEYAALFRLVLPGLERLRLPIPLGGTTLFFRRNTLEDLGAWDAHNVTEDADLGIRLARHGYRTVVLDTVTEEEANCRLLPWVRQRSRWIKGYMMTWAVHMRDPLALWRDLGPRGFFGFQVMFLAAPVQFLLAPVLWSFWALALGLGHPLADVLPGWAGAGLIAAFVLAEAVNVVIGMVAVSGRRHRGLRRWVPTLHLYYPLAAAAAWKAAYELLARPFYWDKTSHGICDVADPCAAAHIG
jgi:cellulose synthase/poly-beta-1,6-N-acetylglucosamine synthase-like glycosyltransferase